MQKNLGLEFLGIIEMLIASMLMALVIWLMWDISDLNDSIHNGEGQAYMYLGLMIISPVILLLFAMGFTAYKNYKSAITLQILGILLIFSIPALIVFL